METMIKLTELAVKKVKDIIAQQESKPNALRIGVRGGGCSGFSYAFEFDFGDKTENDQELDIDGLKVRVDNMSGMYLDGCEVDYVETLESSGFKFNNPNVKSTCGCGSSFSA
jgi:iron-sulfur cluster assembly accessory protein